MGPGPTDAPGSGVADAGAPARAAATGIGRELGGNLPCVMCGYNLRGLSIRGVCPECGVGVRATILAVVDPEANLLKPIAHPRLVAGGLMMWTGAALLAALACWWPHLAGALTRYTGRLPTPNTAPALAGFLVASALGAAALVRPHAGIPAWQSAAAVAAVVLYAPLGWALVRLGADRWPMTAHGLRLATVAMLSLAGIFLLLRPIARLLVARSLLLRSGRVDRQTLLGMAVAAVLVAGGHGLVRMSEAGWVGGNVVLRVLGVAVMVVSAALLTLGLVGSVADSARIAQAILRPRRSVREVVRSGIDSAPGAG